MQGRDWSRKSEHQLKPSARLRLSGRLTYRPARRFPSVDIYHEGCGAARSGGVAPGCPLGVVAIIFVASWKAVKPISVPLVEHSVPTIKCTPRSMVGTSLSKLLRSPLIFCSGRHFSFHFIALIDERSVQDASAVAEAAFVTMAWNFAVLRFNLARCSRSGKTARHSRYTP